MFNTTGPAGAPGLPGITGPQGPKGDGGTGSGGTRVYDANGQDLGILLSADASSLSVYNTAAQVFEKLETDPDNPAHLRVASTQDDSQYYYTSADCSGTPLTVFDLQTTVLFAGFDTIFGVQHDAEVSTDASGTDTRTGKYVKHGELVDKSTNPATDNNAPAIGAGLILRSRKGTFAFDGANGDVYSSSGCTPIPTLASLPPAPVQQGGGLSFTYNGITYPDSAHAFRAYSLDLTNFVEPGETRYVYKVADAPAPFAAPPALPLTFR